jgi:hypothetical protein
MWSSAAAGIRAASRGSVRAQPRFQAVGTADATVRVV